jgi:hypothetical protein
MFIGYLRSEPEKSFDDQARKYLRPDKINYLTEKFPRSNYQSASEWAKALTNEIFLISMRDSPGYEPPEPEAQVDSLKELARLWKTEQKVAGCMIHASEVLEYDFKETVRLEARIVSQTRHCAELKAWEEMHNKTFSFSPFRISMLRGTKRYFLTALFVCPHHICSSTDAGHTSRPVNTHSVRRQNLSPSCRLFS